MPRAEGTFDVDTWEERPLDEREGARLSRAHLTKTYRGGLTGTSTTDILIALTPVEGSRGYVGLERFTGTLAGRAGTFVLQHDAMGDRGEEWMTWRILADSGTGALRGIRGEGRVRIEGGVHRYHLDYAFADD
jgi:hypothetical protein